MYVPSLEDWVSPGYHELNPGSEKYPSYQSFARSGKVYAPAGDHALALETDRRWMTLVEAIAHVQSSNACTSIAAQIALKKEIGGGAIPVKWADSKGPTDIPELDDLPRLQLVLSGPGLAPDDFSLRPLLLLRAIVLQKWPSTGEGANASLEQAADEETDDWMSLVEAVDHIRVVENCDSIEALRQLKEEIRDGMVSIQWRDGGWGPPPDPQFLSSSQLWLLGSGFAQDESGETYRPLLVARSAVQTLWPLRPGNEAPHRRKYTDDEIREASRQVYKTAPQGKPPNQVLAEQLVRKLLPGAKREAVLPIIQEDEFARLRLKPGNQPKR